MKENQYKLIKAVGQLEDIYEKMPPEPKARKAQVLKIIQELRLVIGVE